MTLFWASIGFVLALLSFTPVAQAQGVGNGREVVRVRLQAGQDQILLSGKNIRFQAYDKNFQAVSIPQTSRIQIRVLEKNNKNIWAVRIDNKDPEHLFTQKYLLIRGDDLRSQSQAVPNKLLLSFAGNEKIDLVGVLPVEDYVMGVIANEMPLSWPLESLKAQAVAARSYALAVIKERSDKAYHLESSVLDQMFKHVLADEADNVNVKKAILAVRSTSGVRLLSPKGQILKAFYHADCGGKTVLAKDVWKSGVNTGVAVDSTCPSNPRAQWNLKISKKELSQKIKLAFNEIQLKRVSADDRVSEVQVILQDGSQKEFTANEFRQALGFQDLKSAQFDMQKEGELYTFKGRGFGHGVGLCQWGSRALGLRGQTYQQILKHYYPLAQIQDLSKQAEKVAAVALQE